MFPKVKDQNYLKKKYLSDFSENKYPKCEFFYIILQTLFPKELETNIKASRKHRALNKMKDKNELINMTPEIYYEIVRIISFPSKD